MSIRTYIDQANREDLLGLARQFAVTVVVVGLLSYIVPILTTQAASNVARKAGSEWADLVEPLVRRQLSLIESSGSTDQTGTIGAGGSSVTLLDLMVELQVFRLTVLDVDGNILLIEHFGPGDRDLLEDASHTHLDLGHHHEEHFHLHEGHGDGALPISFVEVHRPLFASNGQLIGVMEIFADASDELIPVRVTLRPLNWAVPVVAGLALMSIGFAQFASTVGARLRFRRLKLAQRQDALTGLPNRKGTREDLEAIFLRRNQTRERIAFMVVDIDDFTSINDTYGPEIADELLGYFADGLTMRIGPRDQIGRIGGDQFLLTIIERSQDDVMALAGAVEAFVAQPFPVSASQRMEITATIGIAFADLSKHGMKTYQQANVALLEAKRRGGNQTLVYTPELVESDLRRRRILELLQNPEESGALWMAYQPLVSCSDERVVGYEALMRLKCPTGTTVSPGEFIPVAEENGLSGRIGMFALREAARATRALPPGRFVSVNLSADQFATGDLPDQIASILDEEGADPACIELEVTETLLLEEDGLASQQLAELRSMGLRLAIDDFGTGHSSLGYLWKFNFDKLKIDRAFVEGYDFDRGKHRQILETIVILGRKLGLTIVLEGVETEEHAELARSIGCDQIQGFYYGRPAPLSEAAVSRRRRGDPGLRVVN